MKIIYLFICILSVTTAKVYPRTGVNDELDGVEGIMYDVPEYEDPEVTLFKLIAKGILPVYTHRDVVVDSKDLANKNDKPQYQTDDIKKGLDAVITQLQEAKNKLESGNNEIYFDIDKSVLYLDNLKHHLYIDLHPVAVASRKLIGMSDSVSDGSSDKGPANKYSLLRASLKKYLSSDDSIYKYFSFDIPAENPTEKPSSSDTLADLSYNFGSAIVPYSPPKDTFGQSSADDQSAEQTFDSSSSKDQVLPSNVEQPLNFEASTEQSFVNGKDMFRYEILRTEMPPVEVIPVKNEEMYKVDDVASSSDTDKVEQGDKTLIRKKWSLKLSSTF